MLNGAHPEATFLGGEPFADFAQRVTTHWERIVADDSWETALLVLHGGVNRMIFNHTIGLSWRGDLCIEQDNCCINIIDVDRDQHGQVERYLIRGVNLTSYDLNKSAIHLTNLEQTAVSVADRLSSREASS